MDAYIYPSVGIKRPFIWSWGCNCPELCAIYGLKLSVHIFGHRRRSERTMSMRMPYTIPWRSVWYGVTIDAHETVEWLCSSNKFDSMHWSPWLSLLPWTKCTNFPFQLVEDKCHRYCLQCAWFYIVLHLITTDHLENSHVLTLKHWQTLSPSHKRAESNVYVTTSLVIEP